MNNKSTLTAVQTLNAHIANIEMLDTLVMQKQMLEMRIEDVKQQDVANLWILDTDLGKAWTNYYLDFSDKEIIDLFQDLSTKLKLPNYPITEIAHIHMFGILQTAETKSNIDTMTNSVDDLSRKALFVEIYRRNKPLLPMGHLGFGGGMYGPGGYHNPMVPYGAGMMPQAMVNTPYINNGGLNGFNGATGGHYNSMPNQDIEDGKIW